MFLAFFKFMKSNKKQIRVKSTKNSKIKYKNKLLVHSILQLLLQSIHSKSLSLYFRATKAYAHSETTILFNFFDKHKKKNQPELTYCVDSLLHLIGRNHCRLHVDLHPPHATCSRSRCPDNVAELLLCAQHVERLLGEHRRQSRQKQSGAIREHTGGAI